MKLTFPNSFQFIEHFKGILERRFQIGKKSHSNRVKMSDFHFEISAKYIQKTSQNSYLICKHKILSLVCAKVSCESKVTVNF